MTVYKGRSAIDDTVATGARARRLLLITVSSPEMRRIRRSRVINFRQVTMGYLGALTPPGWIIEHVDEEVDRIDYDKAVDLVGITFHTPSAYHAYDIAKRFRERKITVALGGPHVTLVPEEASAHADVIFIGEAETTWPRFIRDFEAGRHAAVYRADEVPSLDGIPFSRKDLFHRKDHAAGVLFATRGCPNRCEFCTISVMYKNTYRKRTVSQVAAEFGSFKGKVVIFWDDNICGDISYAKELFKAVAKHKKWWSSQASVHIARDDELLELAAKSGCKQIFLGLESISQASLDRSSKTFNRVADYRRIIEKIHSHGIAVQVGIVFGFDEDTKDIFEETADFLDDSGVQNATFNILTPYPNTKLFKRLQEEGRILTYDWSRYNAREDVVFMPKHMTPAELLEGFRYVNDRFYSVASIARRLSRSPTGLWWTLPLNAAYLLRHITCNSFQKRPALAAPEYCT